MSIWKKLFGGSADAAPLPASKPATADSPKPAAQQPEAPAKQAPLLTRHYSNKEWEFELDYPTDWQIQFENDSAGEWTVAVCLVGPTGSGGRPGIMVNTRRGPVLEGGGESAGSGIRVITIGAGGQTPSLPKTARDYMERSKPELARSFSGFRFVSGEEIQVAGRPAAQMVYSYDGGTGRIQEMCVTRFGIYVTFQFTCEAPATGFPANEPLFQKIIESFRLKS